MNWTREGEVHVSEDCSLGWYTIIGRSRTGYRAWLHRYRGDSLIVVMKARDLEDAKRDIDLFDRSAKAHNVVAKARAFAEETKQ